MIRTFVIIVVGVPLVVVAWVSAALIAAVGTGIERLTGWRFV
jgi:hypothetical protein